MSDYQAVYDAVRSRMGSFNTDVLMQEIVRQFDCSWQLAGVMDVFVNTAYEMQKPSVLYKPSLSQDGNAWIALYGENIAVGVVGTGASPAEAIQDFDKRWFEKIPSLCQRVTCPVCLGGGKVAHAGIVVQCENCEGTGESEEAGL